MNTGIRAWHVQGSFAYKLESQRPKLTLIEGGRSLKAPAPSSSPVLLTKLHNMSPTNSFFAAAFIFLLSLSLFVLSVSMGSAAQARRAQALEGVKLETFLVSSGDALWTIAEEHCVEGLTISETIDYIVERNELNSAKPLQIGQVLLVPAS